MSDKKTVKEIMVGIADYSHVPYWFSISKAAKIVEVSFFGSKKRPEPMALLVFDEKYNLLGTVTLKDVLKGVEPNFLTPSPSLDSLLSAESKEKAGRPVSEIMVPAKAFVEPDESVVKAAHLMIFNDLILLPVLENRKKFIGLVRMTEIFDELSKSIL